MLFNYQCQAVKTKTDGPSWTCWTASHHALHGLINSQCSLISSNNFRTDTELVSPNFRTKHNFRRINKNMKKPVDNYFIWTTVSHLTCKTWRSGHIPPYLAFKSLYVDPTFSWRVQRDSQSIQSLFPAHHPLTFLINAVCVLYEVWNEFLHVSKQSNLPTTSSFPQQDILTLSLILPRPTAKTANMSA